MTLESKLRALVAKVKAARNGFLDGMPYILTYGDIIADLEALLAERQPAPLSAEQVALVIAANKLLPDPPGGYDMEGIAKDLNALLAAEKPALAETGELRLDSESFHRGFAVAKSNFEMLARDAVAKGWSAEGLLKLLFESPSDPALAERQEPPEPFSDKTLLALAEDMLADCTAEQVQSIWQRAVFVKQNPWQVIADLLNTQRTGAAAPSSGTGAK